LETTQILPGTQSEVALQKPLYWQIQKELYLNTFGNKEGFVVGWLVGIDED
jgi:hypothetical protein